MANNNNTRNTGQKAKLAEAPKTIYGMIEIPPGLEAEAAQVTQAFQGHCEKATQLAKEAVKILEFPKPTAEEVLEARRRKIMIWPEMMAQQLNKQLNEFCREVGNNYDILNDLLSVCFAICVDVIASVNPSDLPQTPWQRCMRWFSKYKHNTTLRKKLSKSARKVRGCIKDFTLAETQVVPLLIEKIKAARKIN